MESRAQLPADAALMPDGVGDRKVRLAGPAVTTGNGRGRVKLVTRQNLDGRTKARKQFDAIADGVADDLKGSGALSTIQLHLIEAFAGCALIINAINAKLLSGEDIDITDHSQAASTLVRLASRLGLKHVPRDVSTLDQYLATLPPEEAKGGLP
jgi:hypothetical protein